MWAKITGVRTSSQKSFWHRLKWYKYLTVQLILNMR